MKFDMNSEHGECREIGRLQQEYDVAFVRPRIGSSNRPWPLSWWEVGVRVRNGRDVEKVKVWCPFPADGPCRSVRMVVGGRRRSPQQVLAYLAGHGARHHRGQFVPMHYHR